MEKLKKRWGLTSNWQVVAVFCVFALNGSLSMVITRPLFSFFNITKESLSAWGYYPLKIILTMIVYQSTFPVVGWLFGQFKFAWNFEKKFLRRIGFGFIVPDDKNEE